MKKRLTQENQLALDIESAAQPAADKLVRKPRKAAPPSKKPANKPTKAPSPQATLPGLSRRGRPRSPNPVSPSVRALESRKRRVAAGGKRIELLLEPEAAAQLDALVEHFKVARGDHRTLFTTQMFVVRSHRNTLPPGKCCTS